MTPSNRRSLILGGLYILLAAGIFSTLEIILKLPAVAGTFHPLQINLERFLVGGVCLIPFAARELRRRDQRLTGADLGFFALIGFLNVPLSMVLFQLALTHGQANVVAVLFSGNPVFVALLAVLILGEKLRWNNLAALGFALAGIAAVMAPAGQPAIPRSSIALAVLSSLGFALYSVLGKKKTGRLGSLPVICVSFLFGAGELLLLLLLGRTGLGAAAYEAVGLDMFCGVPLLQGIFTRALPYFLVICLVNSAAGYVFHMLAIETAGAIRGSLVFVIKPVLAPLLAWAVLGEAITLPVALGVACFLGSGLMGFLPDVRRSHAPAVLHPNS